MGRRVLHDRGAPLFFLILPLTLVELKTRPNPKTDLIPDETSKTAMISDAISHGLDTRRENHAKNKWALLIYVSVRGGCRRSPFGSKHRDVVYQASGPCLSWPTRSRVLPTAAIVPIMIDRVSRSPFV